MRGESVDSVSVSGAVQCSRRPGPESVSTLALHLPTTVRLQPDPTLPNTYHTNPTQLLQIRLLNLSEGINVGLLVTLAIKSRPPQYMPRSPPAGSE